ncbi:hypothetical protein DPEC_G00335500 [Dallia pectoralis]|uniref:Uncharacterized protein n=1 Tax=Dallia pectoralis TaxID=75939 RepID=A0ACC2F6Z7_DALPE|nr:hypothetical protein DPEC_G00335500 [Dallia pectoralis]
MLDFLLGASLVFLFIQKQACQANDQMHGPQHVLVNFNCSEQRICVTWEDHPSDLKGSDQLIYDLEVLLTDSMKELHHEAVHVTSDPISSKHHWSWTPVLPLQCASQSVRLRSRYQNYISQWSPLQTNNGINSSHPVVYPRDRVVQVDSNVTFCCILGPGQSVKVMDYNNISINATKIGPLVYEIRVRVLTHSPWNGFNVQCFSTLYGTCVYVGYPPGDRNLTCETRDLVSVECDWDIGRDTRLTKKRKTVYRLNDRACHDETKFKCKQTTDVEQGERNWTLTARNPLGTLELVDRADLKKRVHLFAPVGLEVLEVNARSASVQWRWDQEQYKLLSMVCQVQLEYSGRIEKKEYPGSVVVPLVLTDLAPAQSYTVKVRCGLAQHFWKWGDWSSGRTFQTKEDIPEMLDVWMQIEGNQTLILWKSLTANQSHGGILDYEVTWGNQNTTVLPTQHCFPVIDQFTSEGQRVTVTARNSVGRSPPSAITIPRRPQRMRSGGNVIGGNGMFDLVWSASPNASCGYVVDWCPTYRQCRPEWLKVPTGTTRARVQLVRFEECVRYTFSIYAGTSGAPELLESREGYVKECLPEVRITGLETKQYGSDTVQISWTGVPPENQTSFLLRYVIYYYDNSNSEMKTVYVPADEPEAKNLTGLTMGVYTFTVKAVTSLGEYGAATKHLKMTDPVDQLITVMFICLGSIAILLTLVTVLCYKKRNCIKNSLYPKIPKPAWNDKWLTKQDNYGCQILHVDRCPPSMLDQMCERELSGEAEAENDAGSTDIILPSTDSYLPAPHVNNVQAPLEHTISTPHAMPFQCPGIELRNHSYNLVPQAALDMEPCSMDYLSVLDLNTIPMSKLPHGCDLDSRRNNPNAT